MSAVLPRSKSSKAPPKLQASSAECKKRKTVEATGGLQHNLSGKSTAELVGSRHVSAMSGSNDELRIPGQGRAGGGAAAAELGAGICGGELM